MGTLNTLGALAVIFALLLLFDQTERTARWYFDYTPCPDGERFVMAGPFAVYGGDSYVVEAPALEAIADIPGHGTRSPIRLCENDRQLGTGHTAHVEIVRLGAGRFSHWGRHIIFTASDNSNPNTNGRKYTAVKMDYVSTMIWHPSAPPSLWSLMRSTLKTPAK